MSIVINGIKMPEAPDEMIELAILGDGTVIQTGESWRSPEDGKCYWTVTNPEKFGNAVSIPEHERLKKRVVYRGDIFNALESARIIALDGILTDRYKDGFHDGLKRALEILANEVQDVPTSIPAELMKEGT